MVTKEQLIEIAKEQFIADRMKEAPEYDRKATEKMWEGYENTSYFDRTIALVAMNIIKVRIAKAFISFIERQLLYHPKIKRILKRIGGR